MFVFLTLHLLATVNSPGCGFGGWQAYKFRDHGASTVLSVGLVTDALWIRFGKDGGFA